MRSRVGTWASKQSYTNTLRTKRSDANVPFTGLCVLLKELGFQERIRGDHHIFTQDGVDEILNLQPRNSQAKPLRMLN